MPWVRIDEHAMDHPKFVAISANSWRLWCEGMTYCQKHLTDGFMPTQGVKGMRYYAPAAVKQLLAVLVPGKGPLWHDADGGYRVHDYHDWNDSRDRVLQARSESRDRRKKWRERHTSSDASPTHAQTPNGVRGVVWSGESQELVGREGGAGETTFRRFPPREKSPSECSDDIAERAGRFCERYAQLYADLRKGARYIGRPALDFQEALQLVSTWDDDRLEKIARVFLITDHEFAEKGSRTMAQFRALASWCDSRLLEEEAKRA